MCASSTGSGDRKDENETKDNSIGSEPLEAVRIEKPWVKLDSQIDDHHMETSAHCSSYYAVLSNSDSKVKLVRSLSDDEKKLLKPQKTQQLDQQSDQQSDQSQWWLVGPSKTRVSKGLATAATSLQCHESKAAVRSTYCWQFQNLGRCHFGDSCRFSHKYQRRILNEVCRDFQRGACSYGGACKFLHGGLSATTEETRHQYPSSKRRYQQGQQGPLGTHNKGHGGHRWPAIVTHPITVTPAVC